jgi:hypothetical protein
VYVDAPVTIPLKGALRRSKTVQLQPGWNLFGPVTACAVSWPAGVRAVAWFWDPETDSYTALRDGGQFQPGRAYWIYAREATSMTLGE